MSFRGLRGELIALFSAGVGKPLSEPAFNELALRVFRFQCGSNPAYRGFVERRITDPDGVTRWEEIPFLPARAFRSLPLVSGDPGEVERVFRTSGTTGGLWARGEHHVRDLDLYRASLLPNFQAHLLPEGGSISMLCLLPAPETAPDSSLSFMMGAAARSFGGPLTDALGRRKVGFFVDPDRGISVRDFREALAAAEAGPEPVLLAGAAFAFLQWLDVAGKEGWKVSLPEGSRILETGGYKGRIRAIPREDLYRGLTAAFGIPARRIVNEYGMTELLSQFYEPVLALDGAGEEYLGDGAAREWPESHASGLEPGTGGIGARFHCGPPWVRTRVLHPLTLEEVPEGEVGVLAHLDLANLGSVSAVLTEDLGMRVPGGFRLLGRTLGAEPRGCSLAMEDFLAVLRDER